MDSVFENSKRWISAAGFQMLEKQPHRSRGAKFLVSPGKYFAGFASFICAFAVKVDRASVSRSLVNAVFILYIFF